MGNIFFAGSEVVELGIQIEKNGTDFYEIMAGKTKNDEVKKVFEYLKEEEVKHIAAFQKILSSVQEYKPAESYPEEYFLYMNALASIYVFTQAGKGKEIADKTTDDLEAIELGISAEKDSILFYQDMKKLVPEKEHTLIEQLLIEEKKHLTTLHNLKQKI